MISQVDSASQRVSVWLENVRAGDRAAVQPLLDRYFHRVVALAATRLPQPHLVDYAEDVALGAFTSLCMGIERGRYPQLANRNELWKLLAVITIRKAINLHRRRSTSSCQVDDDELQALGSGELSPDAMLELNENAERLLSALDDDEMRQIARWKVDGYTNEEIAEKLGRAVRTIERKLHRIRRIWEMEVS